MFASIATDLVSLFFRNICSTPRCRTPDISDARHADIAAVKNKPMVRYREQMFREMLHERAFRFQRSLGIVGQPYAVRHTKHVGVDRHRRLVEHHRQYHISRLAAHSRQFNQFLHRRRHFPAISLHKHPRRSYQQRALLFGT